MAAAAKQELRQAVSDCRERGLFAAAKWAAQQLVALPVDQDPSSSGAAAGHAPSNSSVGASSAERDLFDLARSFFDCKVSAQGPPLVLFWLLLLLAAAAAAVEGSSRSSGALLGPPEPSRLGGGGVLQEYRSAAHTLAGVPSPRARFLRGYSTYLAGEKAKE